MIAELKSGLQFLADGALSALRGSRHGALIVADGHGRYYEETAKGVMFTLTLTATSGTIAAGNIFGAAAAASTQFALLNPPNSGKNLVLQKFGVGVISGTAPAGPIFHGYIPNAGTITAAPASVTPIRSNILGAGANSVASAYTSAAGATLTGGLAPVTHRLANFADTATATASVNLVSALEEVAGDIIVPPNTLWLPLWSGAGTTLLNGYSITWSEVSI